MMEQMIERLSANTEKFETKDEQVEGRSRGDCQNEGLTKRADVLPRNDNTRLQRQEPSPVQVVNVAANPEVSNEEAEVETV